MTIVKQMDLTGITDWVGEYRRKHGIIPATKPPQPLSGEAFGEFFLLLNGLIHTQNDIGPWLELTGEGSQEIIDGVAEEIKKTKRN